MHHRMINAIIVVALFGVGCRGPNAGGDGKPRPATRTMSGIYGVADAITVTNPLPGGQAPSTGALFLTKESGESEKFIWWGNECSGIRQLSEAEVQQLTQAVLARAWVEVETGETRRGTKCLTGFTIFNR